MTAAGIPALLEPIQTRLDAATPGPWAMRECSPCTERGRLEVNIWDKDRNFLIANWCDDDPYEPADAVFIANAPTDTARLLAAVKAVEDWCKNLDAMEEIDPSSAAHRNVSAGGVARTIRAAVEAALRCEA